LAGRTGSNLDALNELSASGYVLAFIGVKKGLAGGPLDLEAVLHCQGICEIYRLLIGHDESAVLLLLLANGEFLS